MSSNYPRAERKNRPMKPRVLLASLALAFIFHGVLSLLGASHPMSGLPGNWFKANGEVINVIFWLGSLVGGLTLVWHSSEWKLRKKLGLLCMTGALGSVMVLPLDWAHRGSWRFNEQDAVGLLVGFCVVSVIYLLICLPVWLVAWLAKRQALKQIQGVQVPLASASTAIAAPSTTEDARPRGTVGHL